MRPGGTSGQEVWRTGIGHCPKGSKAGVAPPQNEAMIGKWLVSVMERAATYFSWGEVKLDLYQKTSAGCRGRRRHCGACPLLSGVRCQLSVEIICTTNHTV